MRIYGSAVTAYLAARKPMHAHVLLWLSARNRSSAALETIGFWTGADHQEFTIGGGTRLYYGAGALIEVDPIRSQSGLKVRTQRVRLSQVAPEVQQAIRGYDPRHCPAEIHRAFLDPDSGALLEAPHRVFKGFIDQMRVTTPAKGGSGGVELTLASAARALTIPVSNKRSDASLRERAPGDALRQYASVAAAVDTWWGRNPPKPPGEAAAPPSPFGGRAIRTSDRL